MTWRKQRGHADAGRQGHREFEAGAEERLGRASPVQEVCAALRDEDVAVRREAAYRLERLRDPRAVDPLFDALGGEIGGTALKASAAESMIEALAAIGGAEVEERLAGLLRDEAYWSETDVGIRDEPPLVPAVEWVVPALLAVGGAEPMLRGLLDVLADQRPFLRWQAARELANIVWNDSEGDGLTNDDDDEQLSGTDRELIAGRLRSALRDEFWLVRDSAAAALGDLGDRGALDDLLACLAGDDDHRVRYSAARALGELGDERAVEPLRRALAGDDEISVAAREALAKLAGR